MKNLTYLLILVLIATSCSHAGYEFVEESYPDGTPKRVRYYKSEEKDVLLRETQHYDDGQVYIEGTFKDGEREGKWRAWHRNGNLWSEGEYQGGKENGRKTVYYENGQKYYEGVVKMDERVGEWTFWDEDGALIKTINYDQP